MKVLYNQTIGTGKQNTPSTLYWGQGGCEILCLLVKCLNIMYINCLRKHIFSKMVSRKLCILEAEFASSKCAWRFFSAWPPQSVLVVVLVSLRSWVMTCGGCGPPSGDWHGTGKMISVIGGCAKLATERNGRTTVETATAAPCLGVTLLPRDQLPRS